MNTEKQNKIEKLKQALPPIDYLPRLGRLRAEEITEADRFYLKNFGIYNHKLRPLEFALRIRVTGGRLEVGALKALYGYIKPRGFELYVTARGQLEVHGMRLNEALTLFGALSKMGLDSWQTFTDNFRNLVTHPLDGLGDDAKIVCYPHLKRMEALFSHDPEWVGTLPRKFNVAVVGNTRLPFSFFANDLLFLPAKTAKGWGFGIYVGGTHSHAAMPLGLFIEPGAVFEAFKAIARIYRDEGPRGSRNRVRLVHMIEAVGLERFRERVALRCDTLDEGEVVLRRASLPASTPLPDGGCVRRYRTDDGWLRGEMVEEVLSVCETADVGQIRLGADQQLYLPMLRGCDRSFEKEGPERTGVLSCIGVKRCAYSLLETSEATARLPLERLRRLGIEVGLSGCLKGCGRHAFYDIGLVGIRTRLYASEVERGVRLYLGALPTDGGAVGRLILYAVPLRALGELLTLIADLYECSGYDRFETFSALQINRFSEPALAFWLLLNLFRRRYDRPLLTLDRLASDEKEEFARLLDVDAYEEEGPLVAMLRQPESYPYREAIVWLEKRVFSV